MTRNSDEVPINFSNSYGVYVRILQDLCFWIRADARVRRKWFLSVSKAPALQGHRKIITSLIFRVLLKPFLQANVVSRSLVKIFRTIYECNDENSCHLHACSLNRRSISKLDENKSINWYQCTFLHLWLIFIVTLTTFQVELFCFSPITRYVNCFNDLFAQKKECNNDDDEKYFRYCHRFQNIPAWANEEGWSWKMLPWTIRRNWLLSQVKTNISLINMSFWSVTYK